MTETGDEQHQRLLRRLGYDAGDEIANRPFGMQADPANPDPLGPQPGHKPSREELLRRAGQEKGGGGADLDGL